MIQNLIKPTEFMNDAKVHKLKIEQDKEKKINDEKMIGHKRKSNEEASEQSKIHIGDDWTNLMANSLKKKSKIETEKEKFLEETKKRKEEQLKNNINLCKSQVFKFDGQMIEKKLHEPIKTENQINNKNNSISLVEKSCQVCKEPVNTKSNSKRISNRCDHYLHYVKF